MGAELRNRVRDWEQRFIAAMNEERRKAFVWGEADCGTLMGAAVRASVPDHKALRLLKRYSSKVGAKRMLALEGGLEALLDRHFEAVPVSLAQTGDIGLVIGPDGLAAGVAIEGAKAIGRDPERGSFFLPVSSVTKTYRVG